MKTEEKELYTLCDLTNKLKLGYPKIVQLIESGKLGYVEIPGGQKRFSQKHIDDFKAINDNKASIDRVVI